MPDTFELKGGVGGVYGVEGMNGGFAVRGRH